ncbi:MULTISPECIES: hypothetical protein [unclassified Mesorhizobium]|uniref:hypothetical protein n=1 Tax=unclassified Mesorhizobium TaxID=325217 RepID=UPI001CCB6590|nr:MULTISPECIES: hypothetical protein [unclassified Mesorhizobium]MBZ9742119.1 hypothetical protein [Mesorhizobium sp. CO1-1-4]MBZ9804760.1 hypothetical protein [Mesorhizobium sp. ES1-6]
MAFLFIGLTGLFVLLAIGQMRELLFYRNIGWDFSVDSNINWLKIRSGRRRPFLELGPTPAEYLASNRQRVCLARPFVMFCVAALAAGAGHITFHPEQWRKEVNGSKVTYHYIGTQRPDGH